MYICVVFLLKQYFGVVMSMKEFHSVFESDESEEKKCNDSKGSDALSEKFLKTRQVLLSGGIDKESAEKVIRQLLILEADSDKPIYLFINSPGGDVSSGFAIFDTIRFINAPVSLTILIVLLKT